MAWMICVCEIGRRVHSSSFPAISMAPLRRGWRENTHPAMLHISPTDDDIINAPIGSSADCELFYSYY